MSAFAAVLCAGLAGFLWPRRRPLAARRLIGLLDRDPRAMNGRRSAPAPEARDGREGTTLNERRAVLTRRGVSMLAGMAVAVLFAGPIGLLAGAGVGVACARLLAGLEPREVKARRARLVADLPIAVDLMAACLRGGSSWAESVEAVAAALGGPLGTELQGVAAQIRLGADPVETWLALAEEPALARLARAAARASDSGSALAPTLEGLAKDQRRAARAEASARAQVAGARAVAPLGLCFLPAFVLIGIVPAVAGIATQVLVP
ncbi:MAG TPA: type II secretion system F family protein [Streptosporangiaceae bacterium]|jgi:Flp pilus assembly protein TadB|nr:type II secretion system F family protein [Streptosporangiaceae bacterium]